MHAYPTPASYHWQDKLNTLRDCVDIVVILTYFIEKIKFVRVSRVGECRDFLKD